MNYLSVERISKSFGERVLFSDISFGINKDQKIAFIAKNGSGKTTLLNIITAKDTPDTGQVVVRNGINVAFLPQEPYFQPDMTIYDTLFSMDNPLLDILKAYEEALKHPEDTEGYQRAFENMEAHQVWDFELHYKQILTQLKITDLDKKVSTLSGGQIKRLALAGVLINSPDVLILDEPTNHLDLEMIEWLEQYFAKENLTLFMVTHDRYFLERVCNEIIELDQGKLYTYKGNYSYFLQKKQERITQEKTEVDKAKNLYHKELDWMRRQPKARTTKSKSRIDDFYQIKEKAQQRRREHQVQLEMNMERLGSKVIEFHNVTKSFADITILNRFSYTFQRGERVGIIGKNGSGKTTFLNLLTGHIQPDKGKIIIGDTVKIGYYTQRGLTVKQGQKVIDVIKAFGERIPLAKGRELSASQLLERFLFDRKKQYDYVEKLSGGELKRLYLCTILITNPNVLILDEPTNDLDILTLNVLESFLQDYTGCIILVSHDRYFMDKIVDHLFVFDGTGQVEDFPGNYSDYRAYEQSTPAEDDVPKKTVKNTWRQDKYKGLTFQEQKTYQRVEKQITLLEQEKQQIENLFTEGNLTEQQIQQNAERLQQVLDEIEKNTEIWMELSLKME